MFAVRPVRGAARKIGFTDGNDDRDKENEMDKEKEEDGEDKKVKNKEEKEEKDKEKPEKEKEEKKEEKKEKSVDLLKPELPKEKLHPDSSLSVSRSGSTAHADDRRGASVSFSDSMA